MLNYSRIVIFSIFAIALLGSVSLAYAVSSYDFSFNFGSFGPGDGGEFNAPEGIAVNSTHIFVGDSSWHRIQIFDPSGNFLSMFGKDVLSGVGAGGVFEKCTSSCSRGQPGTAAGEMNGPSGVAVNSTHIFVTDGINNDRVQIFDLSGNFAMMFGFGVDDGSPAFQTCTSSCQVGIDGSGDGQFSWPGGIAVNSTHIFVADRINDDVQIFDLSGNFVDTFGTTGTGAGNLNQPLGVAVNSTHIFVTEDSNSRVSVFNLSGDFVSMFGFDVDTAGGTGFEICTSFCQAGAFGNGEGQFSAPSGIDIDSNGRIFVYDENEDDVQIFDSSFNIVDTIADSGGGSGDGELDGFALTIDSNDRVLVADVDNSRVSVFALSSAVEAGDFILSFDGSDGAGVQFSDADEVATDSNNRIITGDNDIAIKVQIYDSAGNFLLSFDGSDGAGTAFANIEGIAVNSTNHIFVVESSKVQIYDSTGSFIAFFDGTNGTGTSFTVARGIAIDSNDRILVSDIAADTIQIFDQNGFFLSTFTGSGAGGTNFVNADDIATDSANRILVADRGVTPDTVQIFDSTPSFVSTFDGTTGGGTQFTSLAGIAADSSDRIFVLDGGIEDTVQVFDSAGSFQSSFDGSEGLGSLFGIPNDIAIDSANRILVIDGSLLTVQIFEGVPLQINFNANLDGSQEVPPVITTGTGMAFFELNQAQTEISFRIEITNLDLGADVTGAHIHSAPLGVNGGIVVGFINPSTTTNIIDAVAGTIVGTIDASSLTGSLAGDPISDLVNEMISGNSYVNIHTLTNPNGEIRGQIEPCLPPSSGNWVVDFDCTLVSTAIAPANVIIQGGSVLTIPSGLSLDIDFTQFNLTVEPGSGVLIKAGGSIT